MLLVRANHQIITLSRAVAAAGLKAIDFGDRSASTLFGLDLLASSGLCSAHSDNLAVLSRRDIGRRVFNLINDMS